MKFEEAFKLSDISNLTKEDIEEVYNAAFVKTPGNNEHGEVFIQSLKALTEMVMKAKVVGSSLMYETFSALLIPVVPTSSEDWSLPISPYIRSEHRNESC